MMDNKTFIVAGLIIAILIGFVAVFMASTDPDGLESTALVIQGEKTLTGETPPDAEVEETLENTFSYESLMPDYSLGEEWGALGGIIAIVVGTILAFLVVIGLAYAVKMGIKTNQ
jgi:cobalt/nickel transport protein